MQLLQDGLVAMLAAVGLASMMWMVVKAVLYAPMERRRQGAVALIPAQGDGECLEQQVRAVSLLRREQGVLGTVLVVDCGLSEEGLRLAQLLAREDRWVAVCTKETIGDYLSAV